MVDAGLQPIPGGSRFAVGTWGGELLQLRVADGEILTITRSGDVIDATPLYFSANKDATSGMILFTAWDRKVRLLDAAGGKILGELEWGESLADDHRQGAAAHIGEHVYLGLWNGTFAAIDPVKLEWVWKTSLDGAVRAAPAWDGEKFWIGTDSGTLYAVNMDGKILRSIEMGTPVRTTPAVFGAGNLVVLSGEGVLSRLKDGVITWKRKLPGVGTYASPLVLGPEFVLVGDGSGAVSLYDTDGALLWRNWLGSAVHMVTHEGPVIWAGTEDGRLVAFSPVSGAILFEFKAGKAIHSMPYYVPGDEPVIIWGSRDGTVRAHDLKVERIPWEGPVQ